MNYQLAMERIFAENSDTAPTLLLHSCCAPCSSSVLETLCAHFSVTVDYYNPNIDPPAEYHRRAAEQTRFVAETQALYPYGVLSAAATAEADYDPQEFYTAVRGLEDVAEGGARCFACYRLRMQHTAKLAATEGFAFFTTTLSVSPHKNAAKLNELGISLEREYGVRFLPSDFKKKNGFQRSTALSAQYGLYRQDYCGCVFSRRERGLCSNSAYTNLTK
ncbi:MAG: epoxyqueuosine reductase QueH [Ruthenibacterium sp.]